MRRICSLLLLTLVACSGGTSRSGPPTAGAAALTSGAPSAMTGSTPPAAPIGRIQITTRGIRVAGRTKLLYGGEVQYYRIRDRARDPQRTQQLWAEALDQLVAADMNLVTTYVPWDVHEPQRGQWRFTDNEDLGAFLELCYQRDLLVIVKPGPFINSEWPNGVGSFGAIPEWFKQQHPTSLALGPTGRPFSTGLLGGAAGRQPSYFAPELLAASEAFFAQLAPIFRRYIHDRPTIVGVQIDNETNFYFSDRYTVDYSSHGLRQYRDWLQTRYGTIADLNAAYGTSHADFDAVDPPRSSPAKSAPVGENLWHHDWFEAGKFGIEAYQLSLRAAWERLGIVEPDILFFTNDSPHTMPPALGRENLTLWDGPTKNRAGLAMLDAYPKQFPTTTGPLDFPFLTGYFSKRFALANDDYAFAGGAPVAAGKCYGAEIEGGLFELPFIRVALPVPDATTDQLMLQHVGRGSALAAIYIFRAGLNRDDTPYFQEAAIGVDGRPRSRYQVLQRWGQAIRQHGDALLESQPVEVSVAIAVDPRFMAPAAGAHEHPGRVQVNAACGVFGLFEDAGLDPQVVDLQTIQPGDLARYRLVVFLNPDVVHESTANALNAYVDGGGHLVNLLGLGRHDASWQRGTRTEQLLAMGLFGDGQLNSVFQNRAVLGTTLVGANINMRLPNGSSGPLKVGPFLARYTLVGGATPLAWDRTFPLGFDGDVTGWTASRGAGTVTHFGTNPAAPYASAAYYRAGAAELLRARELARWLADRAGVRPVVSVQDAAATCWARRVPGGGAFVFLGGRLGSASQVHLDISDLAALGLDPSTAYTVTETLTATGLGQHTGADLQQNGLTISLPAYGAAMLRLE